MTARSRGVAARRASRRDDRAAPNAATGRFAQVPKDPEMSFAARLRSFVVDQKCVPWSVSHRYERWLETAARARLPALYQLAHFGRLHDSVQPVTCGPKHHFFGYYDKSPWNASGTLLAAHEVGFNDRPPGAADQAAIGVVHLNEGCRFDPLGETRAWNWQQGAMLQWHPADPERTLIHNDRRDGRFVAVVRDITGKEQRVYAEPFYALAPDGRHALSLNFARLHTHRPGYGYAGVSDPWAQAFHPVEDGIRLIDLETGQSRLIVSLAQLAGMDPKPGMRGVHHWINHIQVSRSGTRFAFFHIWRVGKDGWSVRLYTCRLDGSELACLLDAEFISHYDWLDDDRIFIWARVQGSGAHFYLCDRRDRSRRVIGDGVLTDDGHGSFSPDRKWILNDTYPDTYGMRTLMLYHPETGRRTDIARLYSPKSRWWGEIRCDLHPRWSRDGTRVCVDSVHDGSRQMYIASVARYLR